MQRLVLVSIIGTDRFTTGYGAAKIAQGDGAIRFVLDLPLSTAK